MDWQKKWRVKAKEHFQSGRILYKNELYRDSLARLYYSAYSIMVAECGEAPKGRWTHKGIVKCFLKILYERDVFLEKEDRELLKIFYEERRKADYTLKDIEKNRVEDYIYEKKCQNAPVFKQVMNGREFRQKLSKPFNR